MMAWLGTALKSSQPNRSAVCRSDRLIVRMIGAAEPSTPPCEVTLLWEIVAMSSLPFVVSLSATLACKGTSAVSAETITIRPDAQTGKQSWPCRELKGQRTPNASDKHSRLGEK